MAGWAGNQFPVVTISTDVGAADRIFTFRVPFPCMVTRIMSAGDSVDSTDKFAAILKQGATTLVTGTTITTPDVTIDDLADQIYLAPNIDYSLTIDYSGTAANVKGVMVVVWATAHK